MLAQVCIQNHPAGDVTSVSVVPVKMKVKMGIPISKETLRMPIRLSCKGCKEEKKRTKGGDAVCFICFFVLFCCSGNRIKTNTTPYGESSIIQLTELKFNI